MRRDVAASTRVLLQGGGLVSGFGWLLLEDIKIED